jgi:hypothetical protein
MKRSDLIAVEKSNECFIIDSIVPFSMNITEHEEKTIASLFFIAQLSDSKVIIIYSNYLIEDSIEKEFIEKTNPFFVRNNFSSFGLAANMIINSHDVYVTDFKFDFDKDKLNTNKHAFSFKAIKADEKKEVEFIMVSNVFNGIKYIDNYIFESVINNYELSTAAITAREGNNIFDVIMVDKIDRIVAMTQIKNSNTCAVEFVIKSGEDKYTILATYDFGTKFPKKKFKGMTPEKLTSIYLEESDQYLQVFSEFCHFNNIDKEYFIIAAKNKDLVSKLFFVDSATRIELLSMVGDF